MRSPSSATTAMTITLSDGSVARLDRETRRFQSVGLVERSTATVASSAFFPPLPPKIDAEALMRQMRRPPVRFADCFRRISEQPRYSPKYSVHAFDIEAMARSFGFLERSRGTMFSSLYREWYFLDGGVSACAGYGFGGHSWAVVQGAEALRALCLCLGIHQPRHIKGESSRRALSQILEEMSKSLPVDREPAFLLTHPEKGPRA